MKQCAVMTMIALISWGCSGSKTATTTTLPEKTELGWIQRADIMQPAYANFSENYDTVHINNDFIDMIKMLHPGVDIVVVLGTWCGDSKREVPRFLKIVDLALIPPHQIKYYGLDRSKKSTDGITERYRIERVPTFIFFKNNNEIGRIVETPRNTLEEDVLTILADNQGK